MAHVPAGQPGTGQPGTGQSSTGQSSTGQSSAGPGAGRSSIGHAVMSRVWAFLAFWYDFIVGDDWLVAVGVVVALVLTYAVSRTAVPAWWIMPVAVGVLLPFCLRRLIRRG